MKNNYFFIDGSSLLSDIRKHKLGKQNLQGKKFNFHYFAEHFANDHRLVQFHESSYRRIVYYFVKNDSRITENLLIPDFKKPDIINDLQIKYCGKKISQYRKADEWLEKRSAPSYVKDSLYKSEKAVDTQICCDALNLLALKKLDRLFLYTNDYDFVPLCQSIKSMGANINLIRLTKERVNSELVCECDAFHAYDLDEIDSFFE
jgi:uncharacterized LabA/DUF88 family protein